MHKLYVYCNYTLHVLWMQYFLHRVHPSIQYSQVSFSCNIKQYLSIYCRRVCQVSLWCNHPKLASTSSRNPGEDAQGVWDTSSSPPLTSLCFHWLSLFHKSKFCFQSPLCPNPLSLPSHTHTPTPFLQHISAIWAFKEVKYHQ